MRVLLAEDSEDLRELFARVLRRKGIEVRDAADGRAALECLSDFKPDLLVTDLMMPVLGGIELILLFRAMPSMEAVPVMALTADATPEAEQKARKAGAADFLAKPVELSTLLTRICELGNSRCTDF